MQVQFNRPVTIDDVTYGKGVHDVPSSLKEHWFFQAMLSDESALVLREDEPEKEPEKEPDAPSIGPLEGTPKPTGGKKKSDPGSDLDGDSGIQG